MRPFLGQPVPGFSTQEFTQLGKRKWIPSHSGRSTSLPSAGQRDTSTQPGSSGAGWSRPQGSSETYQP